MFFRNKKEKEEKVYRYSLKKYSFGLVSVVTSALIFMTGGSVHALENGVIQNNVGTSSSAEKLVKEEPAKKELPEIDKKPNQINSEVSDTVGNPSETVKAHTEALEETDKTQKNTEGNVSAEFNVKPEEIRSVNDLKPAENLDKEKGNLQQALDELDANIQGNVDKQDRTEESLEKYRDAIRKATKVKEDAENLLTEQNLTKEKLEAETKKVKEVSAELTKAKEGLEYDKTAIKELGQQLNEAITTLPDLEGMTKDSIAAYHTAVSEAQKVQEKLTEILDNPKVNISTIAEIKTDLEQEIAALESAKKNLQVDKEALKAEIEKLKDLNETQREVFNEKIDGIDAAAANKPQLVDVVNEAKETNKLMQKVKALLADDNEVEESINFKEADKDKQDAYQEAIKKATELIVEKNKSAVEKSAVEDLINKIEASKKSLNGEELLKTDKQEVESKLDNELINLNKGQKESAKEEIKKAQTRAEVKNKKEEAIKLNGKMGKLEQLLDEGNKIAKTPKYTNADSVYKKEFDSAMEATRELLHKNSNINAKEDQVDLMIKALEDARNNLNGKDLDVEKGNLQRALDELDANIQGNVDKQDRTKESLEKYRDAIRKATRVKEDAENLLTEQNLTKEKLEAETKKVKEVSAELTKAKEGLEYDKTAIKELGQQLNEAITTLPDLEGMTKDSIAVYQKAVSEAQKVQEELEKVLDNPKADISTIAEIKTALEQEIAALELAKKNLQVDKDALKAEIEKLKDLNEAQRAGFNGKIDGIDAAAANKSQLVDVVNEAKETDKLMQKVKALLADNNEVEASINFKEADKDKQDAYREAIKKATELIAEKNKPGSDKQSIESLINKIEASKKSLNGEALLKADKQEVENKLDNELLNLNKGQKESAKASVEKAKTREEVKKNKEEAVKLNNKMGELKKLVDEANNIVKSPKYTNADSANKKEFDSAMEAARELLHKNSNINAKEDQVDLMIKALEDAKNNLNGKDEENPDKDKPNPDNNKPKPDNNTPKPDNNNPKPDNNKPKPDNNNPNPDNNKPKPDNNKPKPDNNKPKPDNNKPKPDNNKPKPDNNNPKPDNNTPKPDNNKPKPDNNTPKPDNNKPKPDNNSSNPDNNKPNPDKDKGAGGEAKNNKSNATANENIDKINNNKPNGKGKLPKTGTESTQTAGVLLALLGAVGILSAIRRKGEE